MVFTAYGNTQSRQDSLFKALTKTKDIEQRVQIYISLAELVKARSPDSCIHFINEARKNFWQINSFPYLGKIYEIRGDISRLKINYDEATRLYKIAIFCYRKQGERKKQLKMLNLIGSIYATIDNIPEAFSYYLKGREVAGELNDTDMLAKINNNLGRIYIASKNYITGIEYYKKALAVFEKEGDSFKKATVYMNLGNAFNHIGKVDSSRGYLQKAITIFRSIKNRPYLGTCLGLYSYSILEEKRYAEALDFLNQGLNIAENPISGENIIESKLMLSDILFLMGLTYYDMGNYKLSRKYLFSCYHLSDSIGLLERIGNTAEYLSKSYERTGQLDSSLYFFRLFKQKSDSLMTIQSINVVKLAEAQMAYEKEIKEKKMQLSYNSSLQKRNLIIFIGIGAILITLVIILILRLRIANQKKKHEEIEKKHAILEKQASDLKLESQNKELTLNVMNLIRKNELMLELSNRLIQIREATKDERTGSEVLQLVNSMEKSTDRNVWEEFELRFKQVHNNYYERLLEKFPDLTPNELKLCALLKLNLTTKDICELSGQRPATLDVARYRLRKKLGISNSQISLVTFLSQI
jgi:tetratricopeptide (TPR) repeat protein